MMKSESNIRIRVADTDSLGVVYYSNYFIFFEIGRYDFLKKIGCSQKEIKQFFQSTYVLDARCIYKSPLRALDEVILETRIKNINTEVFTFYYKIYNSSRSKIISHGFTIGIFINKNCKAIKQPIWFLKKINK